MVLFQSDSSRHSQGFDEDCRSGKNHVGIVSTPTSMAESFSFVSLLCSPSCDLSTVASARCIEECTEVKDCVAWRKRDTHRQWTRPLPASKCEHLSLSFWHRTSSSLDFSSNSHIVYTGTETHGKIGKALLIPPWRLRSSAHGVIGRKQTQWMQVD